VLGAAGGGRLGGRRLGADETEEKGGDEWKRENRTHDTEWGL
jgi:hypothetical protein